MIRLTRSDDVDRKNEVAEREFLKALICLFSTAPETTRPTPSAGLMLFLHIYTDTKGRKARTMEGAACSIERAPYFIGVHDYREERWLDDGIDRNNIMSLRRQYVNRAGHLCYHVRSDQISRNPNNILVFSPAPGHYYLTTRFHLDGDPSLPDDFAYTIWDGVIAKTDRQADADEVRPAGVTEHFSTISFDFRSAATSVKRTGIGQDRARASIIS